MSEKTENLTENKEEIELTLANVELKPSELTRILRKLGMKQVDFTNLIGKTKGWYSQLLYDNTTPVPIMYLKTLSDKVGEELFFQLVKKDREKQAEKLRKIELTKAELERCRRIKENM